jgi:hypothetical protein
MQPSNPNDKPEMCYCTALPKGSGLCVPCCTRWLAGRALVSLSSVPESETKSLHFKELQRSNVSVLEVTLRQTRDRFTADEVTRTDAA